MTLVGDSATALHSCDVHCGKLNTRNPCVVIGLYAQAQAAPLESSPINPSTPSQHLSFPRPSGRLLFPYQALPFSYPSIERYSSLSKPPTRSSSRRQQLRTYPNLYSAGVQEGWGCSWHRQRRWDRSDILFFCNLLRPNGRIFHSSTPTFIPHILGCAAPFLRHVCNLGSTFFRPGFVLLSLPPLPLPDSPHFLCLWSTFRVLPSWSRIYASRLVHLTHYMIHDVYRLLFLHPPLPIPP